MWLPHRPLDGTPVMGLLGYLGFFVYSGVCIVLIALMLWGLGELVEWLL